ncbi:MAG: hypothetical protein ABJG68_03280 [Crocinitomicaceae bacterium]
MPKFTRSLLSLAISGILMSCGSGQPTESIEEDSSEKLDYPSSIEKAHSKAEFLENESISFDFLLMFRGSVRIDGSMTLATNSSKGILFKGDDKIMYDGGQVFYSPSIEDSSKVRFDAYTWSYFFLFPYKLNDEGTVWKDYPKDSLNNELYEAQKLTFESGTGDAPDDWYITYAHPDSKLLHAAAYIVTYSKDKEKAEEDPHAIVYKDYKEVNGISIAHAWEFYGWRDSRGLTEQLGSATLSNFKFHKNGEVDYSVPQDFKEI